MFKFVTLLAVIAAAATELVPYSTPLVSTNGLATVGRAFVSYQPVYPGAYPSLYSAEHIPLTYANNYVAYKAPLEAPSYHISY